MGGNSKHVFYVRVLHFRGFPKKDSDVMEATSMHQIWNQKAFSVRKKKIERTQCIYPKAQAHTHTHTNICACYRKFLLHIQVFFNVLFNRVPQGHLYKDRKAVKTNDESFLLVVSRY